jgi:hypothetical protein
MPFGKEVPPVPAIGNLTAPAFTVFLFFSILEDKFHPCKPNSNRSIFWDKQQSFPDFGLTTLPTS